MNLLALVNSPDSACGYANMWYTTPENKLRISSEYFSSCYVITSKKNSTEATDSAWTVEEISCVVGIFFGGNRGYVYPSASKMAT